MTTVKDIRVALTKALKAEYPNVKVYGFDTVEGYERPSFFVYVTQTFYEPTINVTHKNVNIEINYIQQTPDEADALSFFERMERLFCQKLQVGERFLNTSDLQMYFDGENKNIPCFEMDVEFYSEIEKEPDTTPLMGEVIYDEEVKRWDYL